MRKSKGIEDRAAATAALAAQLMGVPVGGKAQRLAEQHSTEELRDMSRSEAAEHAASARQGSCASRAK